MILVAALVSLPFFAIGYGIFLKAPRTFWWWVALVLSIGVGSILQVRLQ